MIHINGNKSSRGSNMFGRRPRNYAQVGLIIVLFLGVAYLMYLNNTVNIKLQTSEVKNQRYHAQHQSLSSQLQVVYEDRSRLENSLQKEKNGHQNAKDELQLQKETHDNIVQDLVSTHNEKYERLEKEKQKTMEQLSELQDEMSNVHARNEALKDVKQQQEDVIDGHRNENKELVEQKQRLQEQYDDLLSQSKSAQQMQTDYASRLEQSKEMLFGYQKLKDVLKSAGADVLKLDHDRLDQMSEADRLLLFAHLGGSSDHAALMEQRRVQLKSDIESRQEASLRQQQQRNERDRQLAAMQAHQANNVNALNPQANVAVQDGESQPQPEQQPAQTANICNLPLLIGSCVDEVVSFYFDPSISACRTFTYTGCGGNDNRFSSLEECEARCLGLNRSKNLAPKQPNLIPDNPIVQGQQINAADRGQPDDNDGAAAVVDPMESLKEVPVIKSVRPVDGNAGEMERPMLLDKSHNAFGLEHDDQLKQVNEDDDIANADHQKFGNPPGLPNEKENPEEDDLSLVAKEEARVKEEERKAKEELNLINNQPTEPWQSPSVSPGVGEVVDKKEALKELGKMHQMQKEIAKVKEEELAKYAALKAEQQKIHGVVDEEEDEEIGERQLDDDEQEPAHDQMLHPPAFQPLNNGPNVPVLDAPNVNEEGQEENMFEEEDYKARGGEEEEDDEEDDDFNDGQDDKRDDEYDDLGRLNDAEDRDKAARRAVEDRDRRRDFM